MAKRDPEERLDDVELRLGVVENRQDRLEDALGNLRSDLSHTRAEVRVIGEKLDASERRIERKIDERTTAIDAHLDVQDTKLIHVERVAEVAEEAAGLALVEARAEWPTFAKIAVTILTGVSIGLIVFALTHISW